MIRPFAAVLLCSSIASMMLEQPLHAAKIEHVDLGDGIELIAIQGDIVSGDEETFRALSIRYDHAVVGLSSSGGAVAPAIEIGKMIHLKEFPTLVLDGDSCTSACALIWVAGSTRYLAPKGHVGFHASYTDEGGKKVETGVGNALVGRYLTLLNLPEKAVLFATAAPPDRVLWLTTENMRQSGIEFQSFTSSTSQAKAEAPPPIITTTSASSEWVLAAETDTTKYYMNTDEIYQAGPYRAAWNKVDHSRDPTVTYFSAKDLWYFDCANRKAALKKWLNYDRNGKLVESNEVPDYELSWRVVVPDSVGEAKFDIVCK